jgi:hypothetical protein
LVQEMRKAREPFSTPGLNEGRLLDADTLKELWRTDNAFAEGPNVDKKISALTTSFKSDTHATRVIGIQVWLVIAGIIGLPPQKLRIGRARPKPVLKAPAH